MTLQTKPMKWPPNRVVDWADARERGLWVAELRDHIFNLYVLGYEGVKSPPPRGWTVKKIREGLAANKEVLDKMLYLAGAPIEGWKEMYIPLRSPQDAPEPPENEPGWPSPFEELPRYAWSSKELVKCFGYIEGQLEYLAALLLVAYPEGSEEQRAHLSPRSDNSALTPASRAARLKPAEIATS